MNIFKRLQNSFTARISAIIGVFLIVVFSVLTFLITKAQKENLLSDTRAWMEDDLLDYADLFDAIENSSARGFSNEDYNIIKPILEKKSYFERGYPYLLRADGLCLIHPTMENESVVGTNYYESIIKSNQNQGGLRYKFPDERGEWKYLLFRYYEVYDAYIISTYYEADVTLELNRIMTENYIGLFISIIIIVFGVVLIVLNSMKDLKKVIHSISLLAQGKKVDAFELKINDEIGQINSELNKLIKNSQHTSDFAKEIGKGNLEAELSLLSDEDELGKALLEMRNNLKEASEAEKKRQAEDQRRQWYNEGIAKFAEIVRKHDDFTRLSTEFIIQLVKYLELNQGGIFLLNDEDENDRYFELIAAYAYDRQKHLDKRIGLEDGYIGACYLEKQTVFLKNVPDDYIQITSGLGQATPKYLLIVPIKTEEEVLGAIELASFEEIPQYYAEFVEKIAENIAASYSSIKINKQTQKLLEESRLQSQQMIEQEEEMRQNMEELQATQEESARTEETLRKELAEAKQTISELKSQLNT